MLSSFLLFLDVYGHNPKKKQPTFLIVPPPPRPTSLQKIGIFSSHSFSKSYLIANHPPPQPSPAPYAKRRGEGGGVQSVHYEVHSLREKWPNTEFFLVHIFSVFSPNTGKYGPEKTPYLDTFHTMIDTKWVKRQCTTTIKKLTFLVY